MSGREQEDLGVVHEDSNRYLQWGTAAPLISPAQPAPPRSLSSGHQSHLDPHDDGKHYYTEYSQVSAIETGFKKLKTNQI